MECLNDCDPEIVRYLIRYYQVMDQWRLINVSDLT